jgi:hypothetical protein
VVLAHSLAHDVSFHVVGDPLPVTLSTRTHMSVQPS